MSWMTDIADPAAVRERALKSLSVPVGLANPLWLAFGAAGLTLVLVIRYGRWRSGEEAEEEAEDDDEDEDGEEAHHS